MNKNNDFLLKKACKLVQRQRRPYFAEAERNGKGKENGYFVPLGYQARSKGSGKRKHLEIGLD